MAADPPFASRWPACAWAAQRLLRERETSYPKRVAAGRMLEALARDRLAAARALHAQWRWVIDPAMPPIPADQPRWRAFGADELWILEQAEPTAAWERKRADEHPDDQDLRERALLAEALLWHQDIAAGGGQPRIVMLALIARRNPAQRYQPEADDARLYADLGFDPAVLGLGDAQRKAA